MEEFVHNLPKLELHAHLNGSLCTATIKELEFHLYGKHNNNESKATVGVLSKKVNLEEGFQIFRHIHELTSTSRGLSLATKFVIRDFCKDNVIYLELRSTPKKNEYMSRREYLICVLDAILNAEEVKSERIIVKLLPSIDCSKPLEDAEETATIVAELLNHDIYGKLIAGLDLSGDCTKGNIVNFIPVLRAAKKHGLKFAIHYAEMANQDGLQELLEFNGIQRCGHGAFMNAEQRQILAQLNIVTECCLTSNIMTSTVSSYEDHHFKELWLSQAPVVLCTDDCGIFNTSLTQEFLIVIKTFNLKINDIKMLCENAVKYAFISDEKERCLLNEKLNKYFNKHQNKTL